ncbi:hypothetical protein GX441_09725 [bacterium]|nr:hypothetical protein [bacterium]
MSAKKKSEHKPLLNVMIYILNETLNFYQNNGVPAIHTKSLFNRITKTSTNPSPIIIKDNVFTANNETKEPEIIIDSFTVVYKETHKALATVWGPKVISYRYSRLFELLKSNLAENQEAQEVLKMISPDRLFM